MMSTRHFPQILSIVRAVVVAGSLLTLLAPETALLMAAPSASTLNVKDYGVKGDGAETETAAIQGAIDACAVEGGCILHFPAGRYVTGTLYFRDYVTLNLAPGAVVATSGRADDYTAPALFYGKGVNAVALTGFGEIQAGPVPAPDETTIHNPGSRLVSLVLLENSTNVRVSGIRFLRSPVWTIALRVVDGAWLDDLLIDNARLAVNTSGIVLDSSTRVSIRSLHYRGGGDGITLQTSLVEGIAPPCEQITVSDSTIESSSMAIKIGTATHGPIRNVVVQNVVVGSSQGGIGIFVRDGGSVEEITFSNLVIQTKPVYREQPEWPIVLDLKRRDQNAAAGQIRGVSIVDTRLHTGGKILVSGIPGHPVRDLRIDGLTVSNRGASDGITATQRPWKSPVDAVSGEDEVATAFLLGYVAESTLDNIRLTWEMPDPAPESHALFIHSVDGISLNRWHARQGKVGGTMPAFQLLSCRNIEIRNSTAPPQTGVWIQAKGLDRQDLFLSGNNAESAYRDLVFVK